MLGEILRRNRLQQKDVAEGIEVSRVTVWNWVSGRSTPTGTNQANLLAYLRRFEPGLTLADLTAPPDEAEPPMPEEVA